MRVLTAARLLEVWESATTLSPVERALALLGAACPDRPGEELARLTIGERDQLLLAVRESVFGQEMLSLAVCPHCAAPMELTFTVADVLTPSVAPSTTLTFSLDEYEVVFRAPNSLDLAAALAAESADSVSVLLRACVLSASSDGVGHIPEELPSHVVEGIVRRMGEADPQADVQLALTCLSCGHHWLAPFDAGSFLWREVAAFSGRLLHDVHRLAMAYGWQEADILAMSSSRRQLYLEMVGA